MRKLRCKEIEGLSQVQEPISGRAGMWTGQSGSRVHALNRRASLPHTETGMIGKYNCNGPGEGQGLRGPQSRKGVAVKDGL